MVDLREGVCGGALVVMCDGYVVERSVVTTLAGNSFNSYADGSGTNARFYGPRGVAVDASGNVFVADSSQRIRKVTAGGGTRFGLVNLHARWRCVQACQSAGVSGVLVVSSAPPLSLPVFRSFFTCSACLR